MPKVSFILPAYKRRFLKEAIASILAQTYRDFELVVVDDCSPENLKEIVDQFQDERLSYHRNEQNVGGKDLVAAWNHALGYATGEWVVLASDDDRYAAKFLEELLVLADRYPEVDSIHCRIEVVDAEGNRKELASLRGEFETGLEMFYGLVCKLNRQVISDFMYRRSALQRLGGYIRRPRAWTSDESVAIALSLTHGVAYCSAVLFSWRMSGENISALTTDVIDKIVANEQYRKWLKERLEGYCCKDGDECALLAKCRLGIDRGVDARNEWLLDRTSGVYWWLAIILSPMSIRKKFGYVRRGIRKIVSLQRRILGGIIR